MGKAIDLTGQRFGRWTVLERAENGQSRKAVYLCRCDCGNIALVVGYSLSSGHSLSCGCLSREVAATRLRTHGASGSRLHGIWRAMLRRCNNPHVERYSHYGGRGIKVCPQWENFAAFREWAIDNGYTDDLSIDRIDVNGNYEPSNCRWIPLGAQQRNKTNNHMLTYKGETKTLTDWADILSINQSTICDRLRRGWSVEEALTTAVGQKRKKT